ncbi:MAG: hypothetical protein WBC17_09845 [Mycobacterium sp.]|jgi:hypothetical protein|nr:hypothetical protein [Mycobacterium sp.]
MSPPADAHHTVVSAEGFGGVNGEASGECDYERNGETSIAGVE